MIPAKGGPKASSLTISRNPGIERARSIAEPVDIRSIRNPAASGTNMRHKRAGGVVGNGMPFGEKVSFMRYLTTFIRNS